MTPNGRLGVERWKPSHERHLLKQTTRKFTIRKMSKINLPECPIELGSHVRFVEDEEQPDRLGYGIVAGLVWSPGHWRDPGWVAIVAAYRVERSPWITSVIDVEIPAPGLTAIESPPPFEVAAFFCQNPC
ncbi:MAG: hypothetical protein HC805_07375 [Alkalinema sp. RL_2_19]|nr:hypothetical protein [Alkalinema sp. RL_2_19]